MAEEKTSTAKLTEKYIAEHPSIKDGLKQGLINYSALARKIADELGIKKKTSFEAIQIAIRRFADKLKPEKILEKQIIAILKDSKIEVKTKIAVATVKPTIFFDNLLELEKEIAKKAEFFHIIQGSKAITIITGQEYLPKIKELFESQIIKEQKDLVEIILKSPEEIEETPGIINYLFSLFAEHGINIIETMSCWTDTLFVIEEKDVAKAMGLLKF